MKFLKKILIIFLISLSIRFFAFEQIKIIGHSMEPTFQNKDRILVEKLSYLFNEPKVGDVVIINNNEENLIKRIVATEGDEIEIKNGFFYRNNKKINEPFIEERMLGHFKKTIIKENHFFFLGDNRNRSLDSRQLGSFTTDKIKGKVIFEFKNNFGKTN